MFRSHLEVNYKSLVVYAFVQNTHSMESAGIILILVSITVKLSNEITIWSVTSYERVILLREITLLFKLCMFIMTFFKDH